MEDFANALAYEIKHEIADRYFGFRKCIEAGSSQYLVDLKRSSSEYIAEIQLDLQRIQYLLVKEEVFRSFVVYTRLPDSFTCNLGTPQPSPSLQRQTLFAGLKGEGFTRRRRHRSLVLKIYTSLAGHIDKYCENFTQLRENHENICQEIDLFYRKNDLSGILSLLRRIDNPNPGQYETLQVPNSTPIGSGLDQDLLIVPPPPVTSRMHSFHPMLPFKTARPELDKIIKQAFELSRYHDTNYLPI
jgi:hypothetical protein